MKIGLFSWYGYDLPTSTRLTHIKNAGFDSTMLWWGDEPSAVPDFSLEDLATARGIGLAVENVHLPYGNAIGLWAASKNERRKYLEEYEAYLTYCGTHGIPMVVMHISKKYEVRRPTAAGIETLRRLVEKAEKEDVYIAIENTRVSHLVETLLDEIDSKYLGLCYDTSHGRLYENTFLHLLTKYSHRLMCVHISDNDGIDDKHWIPGEGVISWDTFAMALSKKRALETVALEVFPRTPVVSEDVFLKQAYRAATLLRREIDGGPGYSQ